MIREFSPSAEEELEIALGFYEQQHSLLPQKLLNDFENAVMQIQLFPEIGTPLTYNARKLILKKFPYSIIYRIDNDILEIIAFVHHSRKPRYWTKRLK